MSGMLKELLILSIAFLVVGCDKPVGNNVMVPRFIGSYHYFPGSGFYKLYKYKVTWGEAWAQCKDDNAHLLIINSPEELEAVKLLLIQSNSDGWSHIGVHDLFLNTRYITVLNEEFVPSEFNKWNKNEPVNNAAEDCVSMFPNGLLQDNACAAALSFICEYSEHF